jgi:hypothetical protein
VLSIAVPIELALGVAWKTPMPPRTTGARSRDGAVEAGDLRRGAVVPRESERGLT